MESVQTRVQEAVDGMIKQLDKENFRVMQDRLQRCAMDCQDQIKDKMSPNASEADRARYRGNYEKCVVKCGDSHVALVPTMLNRMKEVLKQSQ